MIDVYSWPTPNGHKVHIMLEECGNGLTATGARTASISVRGRNLSHRF